MLKRQVFQRPFGAGERSVEVDANLSMNLSFAEFHIVLFDFAGSLTVFSALKLRYFPQCEPPLLAHVKWAVSK
jgi:hypothetical protein